MKIELIDENRIKVILSCLEILNLNNDITELFGETASHRLLTSILNEAFFKYGFTAKEGKIMVESYPTPNVGYTVIVTKFEEETKSKKVKNSAYVFENYKALKSFSLGLGDFSFENSTLYELDGKYYLFLNLKSNSEKISIRFSDYGQKVEDKHILEGILQEYGKIIFENNAIKMLKNHVNE